MVLKASNHFSDIISSMSGSSRVAQVITYFINNPGSFNDASLKGYIRTDYANFLDLSSHDNLISFIGNDKYNDKIINPYDKKIRVALKAGRIINRILTKSGMEVYVTERDVTTFANIWQAHFTVPDFKIYKGEEIKSKYLYNSYYLDINKTEKGTLWKSCMRGPESQKTLDLYVNNPDIISLLVFEIEGKVAGRAILWNFTDANGKQHKIMDRIYTYEDHGVPKFIQWAKDNGYHYKKQQRADDATLIFNDKEINTMSIPLPNWEYKVYPYMDTFKYIILDKDKPVLISSQRYGQKVRVLSIDYNNRDYYLDGYQNTYITSGYEIWCDYGGGYCHRDMAIAINGKYAYPSFVVRNKNGKHLIKSDTVESKLEKDHILKTEVEWSAYHNDWIYKSNVVVIDGQIYHKGLIKVSKRLNKVFSPKEATTLVCLFDGDFYPEIKSTKIGKSWFPSDELETIDYRGKEIKAHKSHLTFVNGKFSIDNAFLFLYDIDDRVRTYVDYLLHDSNSIANDYISYIDSDGKTTSQKIYKRIHTSK